MASPRAEELVALLEKGIRKTNEILGALPPERWQTTVYSDPNWNARDLLAHFVSAEEILLQTGRQIAEGDVGVPREFDIDAFNLADLPRYQNQTPRELLTALNDARQRTVDWIRTLNDGQLERKGRMPGVGEVTLEFAIKVIYGHQLTHMRDLASTSSQTKGHGNA